MISDVRRQRAQGYTTGQLGFEIAPDETSGVADRRLLVSAGYARAGIMALPPGGREPGWLPYVEALQDHPR